MQQKSTTRIPKINVFEANAAQLQRLQELARAAYLRRNDGDVQWKVWQEAVGHFHESYEMLAFPGGLGQAMELLEKHDTGAIEMVVRFLEADPWYFRSGYHKAEMIRRLRKSPLTEDQRKRLQQVILDRIEARETPREFRWYCRLAPVVADSDFERQVAALAEQPKSIRGQHACWVLTQIRAGAGSFPKPRKGWTS